MAADPDDRADDHEQADDVNDDGRGPWHHRPALRTIDLGSAPRRTTPGRCPRCQYADSSHRYTFSPDPSGIDLATRLVG